MTPPVSTHPADIVRAGIYGRQSEARTDGSKASTETQLAAGTSLADARGWHTSDALMFADIGRSGWDPTVIRDEFERMMNAVRAGLVDVIIVHELSRLTRKGAFDAMEIDEELKKYGVRLVSVLEPFIDTSSPIGQAIFALIAALAKQDSDMKSARLINTKASIAAIGGRHSSTAPYGMAPVRKTVGKLVVTFLEPEEVTGPVVARMVGLAMDGHTYGGIAKTLNADAIAPPGQTNNWDTDKRRAYVAKRRLSGRTDDPILWRAQSVRQILTHPVIGGFASVRRNNENHVARNEVGEPISPHKGVITGTEWLALQEVLSGRLKPRRKAQGEAALLSGWLLLECGMCNGSMGKSVTMYMCANPVGHGGLSINRAILDTFVAQRVWARLANSDLDDPFVIAAAERFARQRDSEGLESDRLQTQAHLDHVRESIRELQADRKAGLYRGGDELAVWRATLGQYRTFEDSCVAKLAEIGEAATTRVRVPAEWNVDPDSDPIGERSQWAAWDTFERRELLALFLERVTVGPGRDADKRIIPVADRVTLKWIEPAADDDDESEDVTPVTV